MWVHYCHPYANSHCTKLRYWGILSAYTILHTHVCCLGNSVSLCAQSGQHSPSQGSAVLSGHWNIYLRAIISVPQYSPLTPVHTGGGGGAGTVQQGPNPAMASQILQNWAKYLQMNFGGLTPQQLAANPLYQQMVRQQQHYWAMLRQQQLLHLHQAAATAGVSATVPGRPVLTPAQLQQLQARMALSQSILNQATAHARLQQQQQFLQQTLQQSQQQQQQARNGLGQVGGGGGVVPTTAVPVISGATSTVGLGQAVRLGQIQSTPGAAAPPGSGVLLKPSSQSGRVSLPQQQQQSQKVPSK